MFPLFRVGQVLPWLNDVGGSDVGTVVEVFGFCCFGIGLVCHVGMLRMMNVKSVFFRFPNC